MDIIGYICILVGYLIRIITIRQLGSQFWRIKALPLVTNGLYSHLRHPMYLGTILMTFGGFTALLGLKPAVCLEYIVIHFVMDRIDREEQIMVQYHGKRYVDYMKRVKRFGVI
jgi:protein-S-isoprenylcysteine O-methyltransferase Ste14